MKLQRSPRLQARIYASKDGLAMDWRMMLMQELPSSKLDFQLQHMTSIHGQLISAEGVPIAGVEVTTMEISKEAGGMDEFIRTIQDQGSNNIRYDIVTDQRQLVGQAQVATTDKEGRFELEQIAGERVVKLEMSGEGVPNRPLIVVTREPPALNHPATKLPSGIYYSKFTHVLPATRTLRGVVRDGETREPLANVDLWCPQAGKRLKTNRDGLFEFQGVTKQQKYVIQTRPSDRPYFASSVTVLDTKGLEPITHDINMQRGITVRGYVTDGERPIQGTVNYEVLYPNPFADRLSEGVPSPCSKARIQDDGSYEIQVHPGPGVLAVMATQNDTTANYLTPKVDLDVLAKILGNRIDRMQTEQYLSVHRGGRSIGGFLVTNHQAIAIINPAEDSKAFTQDLTARAGSTFRGRVLNESGTPLQGVEISGLKPRFMSFDHIVGNDFQAFAMEAGVPRTLTFYQAQDALGAVVTLQGNEKQPFDVKLQPCGSVTGRLLDKAGSPLVNAQLVMHRDHIVGRRRWHTRTDAEGRFTIKGLVPRLNYTGIVEPNGQQSVIRSLVLKSGETKDLGDVMVK